MGMKGSVEKYPNSYGILFATRSLIIFAVAITRKELRQQSDWRVMPWELIFPAAMMIQMN